MDLIAKQVFPYAGKELHVGESFEATANDAALLVAIGRAEMREMAVYEPAEAGVVKLDDVSPTIPAILKQKKRGPDKTQRKRRGTYKRRDMSAE